MELFANINTRIYQYAKHYSSVRIVPFTPQLFIFEVDVNVDISSNCV